MICLFEDLKNNSYPGRGIVIGRSEDGGSAALAYFIMGRSTNSRNRVFVREGEGIRTEAYDPAKLTDPSLVIYAPVRIYGDNTIVTNGDQTDTVYDTLSYGGSFESALRNRTFEPDAPNYTPRISGIATIRRSSYSYKLSILKSNGGDPTSALRFFYEYETPLAGQGHFIHTYRCDGDPIPSFEGEPKAVRIEGDIRTFSDKLWKALNPDNKVSLFVRFTDLTTGAAEMVLFNKNKEMSL